MVKYLIIIGITIGLSLVGYTLKDDNSENPVSNRSLGIINSASAVETKMNKRKYCEELLHAVDVMEKNLKIQLQGISQEHLNHSFADHKMTIGQMAVHAMAWPRYFLSEEPPWEQTKWTCRPCEYPLTVKFVNEVVADGSQAMREKLNSIDDSLLEVDEEGKKGPGYILYRLQVHSIVHAMQIGYLRHLLESDWKLGGQFGDMANALIGMSYHTTPDLKSKGF